MNLKNASIYMAILALIVSTGLLLQYAILDLQNSKYVTFSDESIDYINSLIASVENNNLNSIPEKSVSEYQEDNIFLSDNSSGTTSVTDVLAQTNLFKGFIQKFINPFKFVFNVPTFLLSVFGLPLEPFKALTILINLLVYIGLILMITKELRG